MSKRNYNFVFGKEEKTSKAVKANAHVSLKYSAEICREIKGKRVEKAMKFLQDVVEKKAFLPIKKYNSNTAHRKGRSVSGVKSGRFPKNCAKAWRDLLASAKANADYKGLDAENLVVLHAFASQGFRRRSHQARGKIAGKQRRKKSAHLEVVLMEAA